MLGRGSKHLIITADDFGRSAEYNIGILTAFQAGAITTASLMVGEPGCDEAVVMAKQNPGLAVGLHLCLSEGTPVSAPSDVSMLIDATGRFPDDEHLLHKAVLTRRGRSQVRREIAAQFARFFNTGLACDHVNVHRNSHMHVLVAREVFRAAALNHIDRVRIPFDPLIQRSWRLGDPLRFGRVMALRCLASSYGLHWINRVIGRDWTDPTRLASVIAALPNGTTELFFHPIICDGDHRFKADLPVLLDGSVHDAIQMVQQNFADPLTSKTLKGLVSVQSGVTHPINIK